MELVDRNQSTVLKQTMKNSVNVVSNKFSRIDSQLINEKLNKKWTMKTLLKKSKPKSEWDKYAVIDRSNWFKSQMANSPSPTHYYVKRLVIQHPLSYGFKNTGRLKEYPKLDDNNHGLWLLPGAYDICKVDERLNQCHRTYSFKSMPRRFNDILFGLQDKNLYLAPGQYNPYSEDWSKNTQFPSYHSVFKSKCPRSVVSLKHDDVPPPGAYNISSREKSGITSPFVSQVPRFKRSKSFVPGPGTYEINGELQRPESLRKMGTHCGLFFRDYSDNLDVNNN